MNQLENYKSSLETATLARNHLADKFIAIRNYSEKICANLENEDFVVQPCVEVSPPKWHLGHTTWFFEELILVKFSNNFSRFNEGYRVLFNSYYKSAGRHWIQGDRGHLSRPTVKDVLAYRKYVDEKVIEFLQSSPSNPEMDFLLEVGLHHEQQHQELLFMDIKYILGANPAFPAFTEQPYKAAQEFLPGWKQYDEGVYEIGHDGRGFAYDNEGPRHKTYIYPYAIRENTVTNGEFLEFIEDRGYSNPKLWLSEGWDWVNARAIGNPLYWQKKDGQWFEFTLYGLVRLDKHASVTHVSYFEADAFANWSGHRLPTEAELEIDLDNSDLPAFDEASYHPNRSDTATGQVWCWSRSHYSPYPGFQTYKGMLGEYNGKFMCNQFVLKGGCVATPEGHYRHSYRNFYQPHQRWMFSGIRLASE